MMIPEQKQYLNFSLEEFCVFLMVILCVFVNSNSFLDEYIAPKWTCLYLTIGMLLCICGIKMWLRKFVMIQIDKIYKIITIAALLESLIGIYQSVDSYCGGMHEICIRGTFDNSVGFSISVCLGLPYLISKNYKFKNHIQLSIVIFSQSLLLVSILISGSRIAIVAFVAMQLYMLHANKKIKYYYVILIVLTVMVSLYSCNVKSVNGRFLIWLCSFDMFCDSPLFGYGLDGFRKYYMEYQAKYFEKDMNSQFAYLADTVQYPYNEFFNFALDFGVLGIGIAIILIIYFIKGIRQKNQIAICSLLGISVFSMTSYPFLYPETWLVSGVSIIALLSKNGNVYIQTKRKLNGSIMFLLGIISLIAVLSHSYIQIMQKRAICNKDIEMCEKLLQYSKNESYYLYDYAVCLYNCGNYIRCREIALLCDKKWSDYDLKLLIGVCYMKEKQYCIACSYLKKCEQMCPCRFTPLYNQFYIYYLTNNKEKAYALARKICAKPEKVPSLEINYMKRMVNLYINQLNKRL